MVATIYAVRWPLLNLDLHRHHFAAFLWKHRSTVSNESLQQVRHVLVDQQPFHPTPPSHPESKHFGLERPVRHLNLTS